MAGFSSLLTKGLSAFLYMNILNIIWIHKFWSTVFFPMTSCLSCHRTLSRLGTLRRSREARPTVQPCRVILPCVIYSGLDWPKLQKTWDATALSQPVCPLLPSHPTGEDSGGQDSKFCLQCESSSFVSNLPLFSSRICLKPEFKAELFPFLFFILWICLYSYRLYRSKILTHNSNSDRFQFELVKPLLTARSRADL